MKENNIKKIGVKLFLAPFVFALAGCFGGANYAENADDGYYNMGNGHYKLTGDEGVEKDTNSYTNIQENDFIDTSKNNKSSFSLCSSTGAYTNIKNLIERDYLPNKDSVILEQMLNYFSYSYSINGDQALGIFNEVSDCPWNSGHKLASIAVKAKDAEVISGSCNFVFLIDVSGSMSSRMNNVKAAFNALVENIGDNDRISIVTYASGVSTVLDGVSGNEKDLILEKVNGLMAGGSTNGSGGIQRAYEIASKHFIDGGNNRVILATDGDFNVGISNQSELEDFIASKRDTGVYLSILGFGMGNYHSNTAETLAKNGNGNMFFIDDESTARRLFEQGLNSVFEVVAKDVKTMVTFNANTVASYRLLGYENALLTEDDYYNTQKDAGEVLSGDVTVAMYELELKEDADLTGSLFSTEAHYKDPKTSEDKEVANDVAVYNSNKSEDFAFQALVVEFGLILRDSEYKGNSNFDHVIDTYENGLSVNCKDSEKDDFCKLVKKAKDLFAKRNQQNQ